jgi:hypothetical protein
MTPSEMHEYLRMLLRVYTKLADRFGSVVVKPHGHCGLTSKLPRSNLGRTLKSLRSHLGRTEV